MPIRRLLHTPAREDALQLVHLYADQGSPKFERAAMRWLERYLIVGVFEGDFDAWKPRFDSDPLGRRQVAKGHMIFRSVDNPNLFFVRIEFDSAEEATSFAEKVRGSDVLANLSPIVPPTVIELADQTSY